MSTSNNRYPEVSLEGLDRSENGVSVVIASYRAPADTLLCLQSLAAQTLDRQRFEVILVVNGGAAADVTAYRRFAEEHPGLRMRIVRSPLAGACHSLNLGIASARMNWVTFVDDDDTVSPQYLEGLLSVAAEGVMPLTRIDDVTPNGLSREDNRINDQIRPLLGMVVPPEDS
ncbi:MAG: glycosyltransferase, partial [Acidimicrobiia bacterium]